LNDAISSKWAGYRPLVQKPESGTATKKIARNHIVRHNEATGLVSLLGGKWTTYRQMGVDVIDTVVKFNKVLQEKEKHNKVTSGNLKLPGGYNPENIERTHLSYDEECDYYNQLRLYLMQKYLIPEKLIKEIIFRFGLNAIKILEIYKEITKNNKSDENIVKDLNTAQVIYTARYEMVVKPNDYICRRSGIAFFDLKQAESEIENVSKILGNEFKWPKSKITFEIENATKNLKYLN
jgi:glycerol-3-phosphate dehydrogenase